MTKYSQIVGNNNAASTSFLSLKSKYFENKSFIKTIQYYLDNSVKPSEILVTVPSYEDVREITFMLNSHKLSVSQCHPFDTPEVEVAFKYLRYFSDFLRIEEKKEAARIEADLNKPNKTKLKKQKDKQEPNKNINKKNQKNSQNDKIGDYTSYYTHKPAKEDHLKGNSTPLLLDNASYNINNSLFQLLNEAYWTDKGSEKEEATSLFLHLLSLLYTKKVSFFEALEDILSMNQVGNDMSGNGIHKDYSKSFTFNFENALDYVVVYNKAMLLAILHMVSSFQVGHAMLKRDPFPRPSAILTHFMRQYSSKKKLTIEQQKNVDKFIAAVTKIEDDHLAKNIQQSTSKSSTQYTTKLPKNFPKSGHSKSKIKPGTENLINIPMENKSSLFEIVEQGLFNFREPFGFNKAGGNGISILKAPHNWGNLIGQMKEKSNINIQPKIVIFKTRDFYVYQPLFLKNQLNNIKICFPRASKYILTTANMDETDIKEFDSNQDSQHLIWIPSVELPNLPLPPQMSSHTPSPVSPPISNESHVSSLEMAANYLEEVVAKNPPKNEIYFSSASSSTSFYSMVLQKSSSSKQSNRKSNLVPSASIIFTSHRIFSLRDPSLTPSINIGFSKINSFMVCPLKYAFRYVLGLKNSTANLVNTSIGAILHEVANEVQEIENELELLITTKASIEKIATKMTALKESKKKIVKKIVDKITHEQQKLHKKKEKILPQDIEKIKVKAQGLDNYLKHEPKTKKKKVEPIKRKSDPDTDFRDSVSSFLEAEKDDGPIDRNNLMAFLTEITTNKAENESKGIHKTTILTEIAFVVKISRPEDRKCLILRGAYDRVEKKEDGDIIIEMKKSFNPSNVRYDESKLLQLKIYALAYLKQHGRLPLEIQIRTFDRADRVFVYVPTMQDMTSLEDLIWHINSEIEKKVFHATPSARICRGCDFANFCPSSILKSDFEKYYTKEERN